MNDDVKVIGHRKSETCPACKKPFFCDDCGFCSVCGFCPPEVEPHTLRHALAPCPECGGKVLHGRTCSVTLKALANLMSV